MLLFVLADNIGKLL